MTNTVDRNDQKNGHESRLQDFAPEGEYNEDDLDSMENLVDQMNVFETSDSSNGQSAKERSGIVYNPDSLLDALIDKLGLKNDAALSRALEVAPPVISKIRHRRLPVGASLLIRMHEVSDLSIRQLRDLMGDRRGKFRISVKQFKNRIEID